MPRKTSLDLASGALFSINGADRLEEITAFSFQSGPEWKDTRSIYDRYENEVVTKIGDKFRFSLMMKDGSGNVQSNLHLATVTATFDSTARAMVGDMVSGSIRISTKVKEASGRADLKKSPQALGTSMEIQGDFMFNTASGIQTPWPVILSAAQTTKGAADANLAKLKGTYDISVGGTQITGACSLHDPELKVQREDFLIYSMMLKHIRTAGVAVPTIAGANPHWLISSILTGTAQVGFGFDLNSAMFGNNAGTPDGTALVTGVTLQIQEEDVLSLEGECEVLTIGTVA